MFGSPLDQVANTADKSATDLVSRLEDAKKARLTTWIIDQRRQGDTCPAVTNEIVSYVESKRALQAHERADRLLRFIADRTGLLGTRVPIHEEAMDDACAWSESTDPREVTYLLDYLHVKGWISEGYGEGNVLCEVLTMEGHRYIGDMEASVDSSRAFVAMWFHPTMDEAYEDGIRQAIEDSGYQAIRIDRKEHINRIDDEIVAEIRRSGFLIADFTQDADGARGGVYYEAGFASGLGLSVIYTARSGMEGKIAFDTRQYNHIFWDNPDDLRQRLRNRIGAVIGDGPNLK